MSARVRSTSGARSALVSRTAGWAPHSHASASSRSTRPAAGRRMAGFADGQDVDVGCEYLLLAAARLDRGTRDGIAAGKHAVEPDLVAVEPQQHLVANAWDGCWRVAGRRRDRGRPSGPHTAVRRQDVADPPVDAADPAMRLRCGWRHAATVGAVARSAPLDYWWNT